MATQKKTEWWDDDDEVGATYVARATQGPLTQSQAAANNTWAGVGQTLSQALYGTKPATPTTTSSSKPKPKPKPEAQPAAPQPIYSFTPDRPTQGPQQRPVQGPQPRPEVPVANSWDAVINRLRPSLTPDRAQTTAPRQFAPTPLYQQPTASQGSIGQDSPSFRSEGTIGGSDAGRLAVADYQSRQQAQPVLDSTRPVQGLQPKPERYGWDDMWAENLYGLGETTANRIKQDWADTWSAGQGNFFSMTEQAAQMQAQNDVARDQNQEVMQRAMQLRQTYWNSLSDSRTLSGMPIPEAEMNINTLSLQPFLEAAEKELGRPLMPGAGGPLQQAASVGQGFLQNLGQVPVLGNVSSATGNTLGTAIEVMSMGPRTLTQVPVPASETDGEFVSAGEWVGSGLEAIINPEQWWSDPDNWTWERNPVTVLWQVHGDNLRRTLDTVYPLSPKVGTTYNPLDTNFLQNREMRTLATSLLDFSGSRAQAEFIDVILNKGAKVEELLAQRDAAVQASRNMGLPEDTREAQALIAAETQLKVNLLQNADAQTLAQMYVKPVQDAFLSTLLDATVWYDVVRLLRPGGLQLPSVSPADRRLNRTVQALEVTEEAIREKVASVAKSAGTKPWYYNAVVEGPLARTEYERMQGQAFLSHMLQGVSNKADVATILQNMVDNVESFVTQGVPANLLQSDALKNMASPATGRVEFPRLQTLRKDFDQLYNSLKALNGQFANLPALADAKATTKDVINNLLDAVEMQSAHRNGVLSIERPVPIGTTEARLTTITDSAGRRLYVTEYVDAKGSVLSRYPAPTEVLGRQEVTLANKAIKTGKYKVTNWPAFLAYQVRRGFSVNVLTLWPNSWLNNFNGAWTTGFTTATNTLRPVEQIFNKVVKAFPDAPFDYLSPGTYGQTGPAGGIFDVGFIKKMREIRSGHTEIRLPGGNTIAFGENAFKAKAWDAASSQLMDTVVDGEWRRVLEPMLQKAGITPETASAFRSSLERLAQDWDINAYSAEMMQYVQGRLKKLDLAGASKHYELALPPPARQELDALANVAKTPEELAQGIRAVVDREVERLSGVAGYDAAAATNPVSVQGTIAETLQEVQTAIEGLARNGIQVGDDVVSIHQGIASVRDHLRRLYSVAVDARTPEAMDQFRIYWDGVQTKFRDTQYAVNRLAREAKLAGDPGLWRDFYQAKLSYYQEAGQYAVQSAEQALARILGNNEVPLPPTARLALPAPAAPTVAPAPAVQTPVSLSLPDVSALRIQFEDEIAQQITPLNNRLRQIVTQLEAMQQAPAAPTGIIAAPVTQAAPALRQALETEARQLMEQVARLQPEIEQRFLDAMRAIQEQPAPGGLLPVTDPQLQRRGIAYVDESDPANPVYLTADEAATYQPQQPVAAQLSDLPQDPLLDTPWAAAEEAAGGPKTFPNLAAAPTTQFRDRRYIKGHFNQVKQWFQDAERQYWNTFMDAAQAGGDIRAIDVLLQVQSDITRIKTEVNAKVGKAHEIYLATRSTPGTAEREAANRIFYTLTANEYYDLGLNVHAKIKAATAYIVSVPEPVTYRHAQYGEVAVVGWREGRAALQLPSGQVVTVAEDAVPATTLQAANNRMQQIRELSKNPAKTVTVPGIPEAWAKEVDQKVGQYLDDLVSSRKNALTAMPTTTDATADTILLLSGLRQQAENLAANLFQQTPRQLTPQQSAVLLDSINSVKRKWRRWVEAASTHGNNMVSVHMIDNSRRWRVDEALSLFFPFHTWTTRTAKNLTERVMTQPFVRHALDMEGALFEYMNGDEHKKYVEVDIGGKTMRVYASLSKYWMNLSDWNADPTYWEQQRMEGPLGALYGVENAIQSRAYPWYGMIDNAIRKQTGQETIPQGGQYTLPLLTLAWRAAQGIAGINTARLGADLPGLGSVSLFGDRDINEFSRALAILANEGQVSKAEAEYAAGVLDTVRSGKPVPSGMTQAQWDAGYKLANEVIQGIGGRGVFASLSGMLTLTGTTIVPQQEGAAEFSAAQDQYFNVAYPGNQAGGVMAQAAVTEANPGIPVYWVRYNLKDPAGENPATQARYTEYQQQVDAIYDRMNEAVTEYIIGQSGRVASYKGVKDTKSPFYDEIDKLKEQYGDILDDREWAPRDVTKMNPYERAVYELEQTLRYDGKAPERPGEDATPEEQVAAWAAIDAWERARLDYIERTIESINASYEGPGDPPADLWVRELEKLTTGEYASELIRKYQTIKNADRVERQWSPYGTFEREMDDVMYQERAENVRERMGDAAVRTFQIYQRVKDENKEQYREEHPEVTVALTAAYNPESYDQAIQMFGSDVWTKYKSYKNAKGALTYPEGGTDEQVDAYYDKLAAIQKQYPGIVEAEFWIDGRHRWWYGAGEENYRSTEPGPREGAMGADYELAKQLFGPDIFKTVQSFPSGGTKKQIAQFYDKHPEYAAYSAWRKQYNNLEEMTLADLPGLNLSQLPAQQPQVPASIPPWWTKFATQGEVSRPLNDPRERINETPAQKQERLAADAAFKQAKAAEAAKVKAIQTQGRAAVVDASGWEDDEFSRRYGRRSGSRRRYYGGRRGRGGGGRRSGGGGGGGYGFEVPGVNPALWAQAERQVTPLNPVGSDINPHLWASVLERLRRPGR